MIYALLRGGKTGLYNSLEAARGNVKPQNLKRNSYWIKSFISAYDARQALDDAVAEEKLRKGKKIKNSSHGAKYLRDARKWDEYRSKEAEYLKEHPNVRKIGHKKPE